MTGRTPIGLLEDVVRANAPRLMAADQHERRSAMRCILSSAEDYALSRYTVRDQREAEAVRQQATERYGDTPEVTAARRSELEQAVYGTAVSREAGMSAKSPEARARKSARQRERRSTLPGYGHGPGLTAAEREARRVAYLGLLVIPSGSGWRERAACRLADPALFSEPDSSEGSPGEERERRVAAAKRFCCGCPVRAECLADAAAKDDQAAIRGGLTPPQRRAAARPAAA
ncbi:MAG TPA: WhiB family transcriptional regulator [Streptosporangiaceae bacterium]|nr:WhiB family transcriptional regulator [Streptosporangiaceae bacterium]